MRTFKQFLNEEVEAQPASEFFQRECSEFIQEAHGAGLLYRGTNHEMSVFAKLELPSGNTVSVFKEPVRKDRKPTDSSKDIHLAVDAWMKDKFGISGRSQTAFAYGEKQIPEIERYGKLHIMIPKGKFRYIWSPEVEDLYRTFRQYLSPSGESRVPGWTRNTAPDHFVKTLESKNYQTKNLSKMLVSYSEVMIECDEIFLIDANDPNIEEIKELLK